MAEFCYECMKKELGIDISNKKVVFSDDLELCEGCGEYKPVVLSVRKATLFDKLLSKFRF